MTVKDFKEWILTLPDDFDDFSMVYREISILNNDHTVYLDKPIALTGIDEENGELFMLDAASREIELNLEENNEES